MPLYDLPKAAPAPLRLLQLFVNTADHENGSEWLPDQAALDAWLAEHGLAGPAELGEALELREALRGAAAREQRQAALGRVAVATVNDAAAALAIGLDDDGRVRISAGDALGADRRGGGHGHARRNLAAAQGLPQLRLELLRLLEEPLRELVLDADLRQPAQDAGVPPAEGCAVSRRSWWRARAPLQVAAARLRAHVGPGLLVLLGVAASIAMLVSVLGGSVIARDREVQQAVAALPESERSFEVDAFGLPPGQDYAGRRPHGAPPARRR